MRLIALALLLAVVVVIGMTIGGPVGRETQARFVALDEAWQRSE